MATSTLTEVVALSRLDEERFGIRAAWSRKLTRAAFPEVMDFCAVEGVQLLMARCETGDSRLVHLMEQNGFELMDTLVYFVRNTETIPGAFDPAGISIRRMQAGDERSVPEIARRSFGGYCGHYHADPRLNRGLCDEVYQSWAVRSCGSKEVADEVLVAEASGELLGFATLRSQDREGCGELFCVTPEAQGKGLYRLFMLRALEWCRDRGLVRMSVSTQITNLAVQKVWVRLGFEPSGYYYTFHKWFTGTADLRRLRDQLA